jgi:hypothetical protein
MFGAARDRDERAARDASRSTYAFDAGDASAPAGSRIDARVLEHVLDRRARSRRCRRRIISST